MTYSYRIHYHALEGDLRVVGPEEFSINPVSWMREHNETWWYLSLNQDDPIKVSECSPGKPILSKPFEL